MHQVSDINIVDNAVLPAPEYLGRRVLRSDKQAEFVATARQHIQDIIFGTDRRLLLIVGPCSIHDIESGREYAEKLADLSRKVEERLYLVMRVYFEKPRTTVGWKGLVMDPHLDGSYDIPAGLEMARRFLLDVIDFKLPTATELLDPITPQYIADLICWSAIGARTCESQTHRQMASGLSMPLGIKNATSGSIQTAINAIKAAIQPQTFLGVSLQGLASAVTTRGNTNCHIILRGGDTGPNYSSEDVEATANSLKQEGLPPRIMIDCSHANSGKDYRKQPEVFRCILQQVTSGSEEVFGAMLESNLNAGSQSFPQPKENLTYGQSITDSCIDWEATESLILKAFNSLQQQSLGATV